MRADEQRRRGHATREAGFTLIEVIVALALFALAATVLASAYVNVLDATERVKSDQAFEQDIALVREQVLLETDRKKVEEGGDVPTAGNGDATWQATVTPSEMVADLFRVDFEVTFNQPDKNPSERKVTQTLWLLRPDWSEPTERDNLRAETRKRLADLKKGRGL
jgi:prepilin-type N-terminal cleavage/methylation domain-containing protein